MSLCPTLGKLYEGDILRSYGVRSLFGVVNSISSNTSFCSPTRGLLSSMHWRPFIIVVICDKRRFACFNYNMEWVIVQFKRSIRPFISGDSGS